MVYVSSRNLFHRFAQSYLFQGYDGQKAYDEYNSGYSKRNDQGHGGGEGYTKKRLVPSEASPHVIFLGLDPDFTESDVGSIFFAAPMASKDGVSL